MAKREFHFLIDETVYRKLFYIIETKDKVEYHLRCVINFVN